MLFRTGLASRHCHPITISLKVPKFGSGIMWPDWLKEHGIPSRFLLPRAHLLPQREHKWAWIVTIRIVTKQFMKLPLPKPPDLVPIWRKGYFTVPLQPLKTAYRWRTVKSCNCVRSTTFGVCAGLICNYSTAILLSSLPHSWHFGLTKKDAWEELTL